MAAIERCEKHGVEYNILVLLNSQNVVCPDELFDFFTGMGVKFLQFITCVEQDPQTGQPTPYSITAQQYGDLQLFERELQCALFGESQQLEWAGW